MTLEERLERIEAMLVSLLDREKVREHYSTEEFARAVGKSEYTCREWARLGRINAEKRRCGRGLSKEWVISHEEYLRYGREGLLPDRRLSVLG